ncbi:uncharacterized protein LOC113504204 isoform X2 [Trichoplusia ni]|nr:uncharacterized protein LOC113504204 isoform X2 [Trichoplusia ni]
MEFFRRLFPQTVKIPLVQIKDKSTELSIAQPSQSNANLIELDTSNNDFSITDTLQFDKTSNQTILDITQTNVTSTEACCNSADKPKTMKELIDVTINEAIMNETDENDTFIKVVTCDDRIYNRSNEAMEVKDNVTCLDPKDSVSKTPAQDKSDETQKSLGDTCKEIGKTCMGDNCGQEIIDLDEFQEFMGLGDEETEKSNLKNENMEVFGEINVLNNSQLLALENVEVISIISSTDEAKSQINSQNFISISSENNSHLDDYNSSDFEFITEEEANMDGFIININLPSQDSDNSSTSSSEPLSNYILRKKDLNSKEVDAQNEFIDSLPGPSGLNNQKHEFEDRSYRNKHVLPEGDQYLDLFRGIYNPFLPVCEIFFLENKSVRASAMNVQYEGIGFDKQLMHKKYKPDSSEDEFEDEAKKCAQKILNMYPSENRKRRRRF